jgi:hypothetical protein
VSKRILNLDFDGVVNSYASGWKGVGELPDSPTSGAIEALREYSRHFDVCIHSSRFHPDHGPTFKTREIVAGWLVRHGLTWDEILVNGDEMTDCGRIRLVSFKPPAFLTIDDRAITFTGTWPDPAELLKFKPWNK